MEDVEHELLLGLALEGIIPTSELPAELQPLPQPDRKRYKHSKNIRAPGVAEPRAVSAERVQRQSASEAGAEVDEQQGTSSYEDNVDPHNDVGNPETETGFSAETSSLEEIYARAEQELIAAGLVLLPDPEVPEEEPLSRWHGKAEAQHAAWEAARSILHQHHVENQAVPEEAVMCEECSERSAVLMCLECCHGGKLLCGGCDADLHRFAHFHRRQVFSRGFWEPISPSIAFSCDGLQGVQGKVVVTALSRPELFGADGVHFR
jgi:hypothetical protein